MCWFRGWSSAWPPEFWNMTHHRSLAFFAARHRQLFVSLVTHSKSFLQAGRQDVSPHILAVRKNLVFQDTAATCKADEQKDPFKDGSLARWPWVDLGDGPGVLGLRHIWKPLTSTVSRVHRGMHIQVSHWDRGGDGVDLHENTEQVLMAWEAGRWRTIWH